MVVAWVVEEDRVKVQMSNQVDVQEGEVVELIVRPLEVQMDTKVKRPKVITNASRCKYDASAVEVLLKSQEIISATTLIKSVKYVCSISLVRLARPFSKSGKSYCLIL